MFKKLHNLQRVTSLTHLGAIFRLLLRETYPLCMDILQLYSNNFENASDSSRVYIHKYQELKEYEKIISDRESRERGGQAHKRFTTIQTKYIFSKFICFVSVARPKRRKKMYLAPSDVHSLGIQRNLPILLKGVSKMQKILAQQIKSKTIKIYP